MQNKSIEQPRVQRHWLLVVLIGFGIFNLGAWLAPLLMQAGWRGAGNAIYTAYSPFCHQMAQRSFFLFGDQVMYNADELPIAATGDMGADTLLMRGFRGDADTGWKVAWSDRMVYMYGAMWLAMLAYFFISRRRVIQPISIWLLLLALLPMAIDGTTHMISDFDGLFNGFRYHNEWLAALTGHAFPEWFYNGDRLGSFNSLMRLSSGLTFGLGVVWFAFPYIQRSFDLPAEYARYQLDEQWIREQLENSQNG